jgi:antagonist of KipI
MKIEILKAGLNTTIQDLGRFQGLAYGVPFSGAMDKQSFRFGNSILDNLLTEAAIEFCLIGPAVKFYSPGEIALTGVNLKPTINDIPVQLNTKLSVFENDVLKFKGNNSLGVYGYICFNGKLDVPLFWGSKSTYLYGELGGLDGRKLEKGDVLEIKTTTKFISHKSKINLKKEPTILISPGPEYLEFSKLDRDEIVNKIGVISMDSNRMGARVENMKLQGTKSGNIISSGTIPGTIQVPASGKPIVLLADSPCTGGYPRIAVVNSKDLDQFCQIKPGASFCFKWES